ncbi:hypothetical protein HNO53_20690 [Billgrantia antri]|uniref:Uncharacterized protein n=1 Tax=Halomonas sulfidivorans TaxID=2733488 RepID=A0ABX7WN33_9GAMM|nr:hypothetical protein [Halomonas sulfidivorans]QTP60917.1 hypothetical protein HNO53_20690 [Halomonas sulfidivorans]
MTKPVPILPPAHYLQPCVVTLGDGSVGEALQGMRAAVECERADKAALRAWVREQEPDDADRPATF